MSVVRAVAFVAALALAACAPRSAPQPRSAPVGSVAVLPFQVGGTLAADGSYAPGPDPEAGPGDHSVVAANVLAQQLASHGVSAVDSARVTAALARAGSGSPDARQAARIASRLGADYAAVGVLSRYREREGSALGVKTPASVAYQVLVVRAGDAGPVAVDRFDYTQQPLSENLLELPMFLRGGARWMTREEMLTAAMGESGQKIAAALSAAPRAPRR